MQAGIGGFPTVGEKVEATMVSEAFPLGAQKCFCLSSRKNKNRNKKNVLPGKKNNSSKENKKMKKKKKKENRSMGYQSFILRLSSFESTEEARVALDCASSNSYASLVLSKLPTCTHNSIYER